MGLLDIPGTSIRGSRRTCSLTKRSNHAADSSREPEFLLAHQRFLGTYGVSFSLAASGGQKFPRLGTQDFTAVDANFQVNDGTSSENAAGATRAKLARIQPNRGLHRGREETS
jgi:hypothetical protein